MTRQAERTKTARAELEKLGITLESVYYTQGAFDFVDFVDVAEAPNAEAILVFSLWYMKQGFGRISTMPAFDEATLESVAKRIG